MKTILLDEKMAAVTGLPVREVLRRLVAAGLYSVPGGGAEILVDRVRREISPHKIGTGQWLEVMREAHGLGLRTSAIMMFGHCETPAERIEHLRRIRDLQDETGGFTAFIPWAFQPTHAMVRREAAGPTTTSARWPWRASTCRTSATSSPRG